MTDAPARGAACEAHVERRSDDVDAPRFVLPLRPSGLRTLARQTLVVAAFVVQSSCSSGDTILALNVSSADDVGLISELRITVTQRNNTPVRRTITPPLRDLEKDAGQAIQSAFFERIRLPNGWDEGQADITIEARSPTQPPLEATGTAEIEPGETVAAFVELERAKPDAATASDAGAADAGSADGGTSDGSTTDSSVADASTADAGANDAQ